MKILVVGFTKIKYMPYLHFYLDELDNKHKVDLLYWNRDLQSDVKISGVNKNYVFSEYIEDSYPIFKKIPKFIRYRRYLLNILKCNNYDKIVVLHSTPGVLIYNYIIKKYKNRYILDYRDVTYERINIYKNIISKLVLNSYCTFVSSKGFVHFLPKTNKILYSHNITTDLLNYKNLRSNSLRMYKPIKISFWGFIRQVEVNKNLITALGNDDRFEIHYYGREQAEAKQLKDIVKRNGYTNIFFHGEYYPEDRYNFAMNTDILHNIYSFGKTEGIAMGNKYYDGLVFSIPQLCNKDTLMGNLVKNKGIGMECDMTSLTLANDIYIYYTHLNWEDFEKNCDIELKKIISEWNEGKKKIKHFL